MSNKFFITLFSLCALLLWLAGCKSAHETTGTEMPSKEALAKAEEKFNPSDYDRDPSEIKAADERGNKPADIEKVVPTVKTDTVRGYRVQVLFTQEIDKASNARETLATALPEQYVYVEYDAPYYKVRVGNFTEKPDADNLRRTLVKQGYPDAWVVPDNVILNLPVKKQEPAVIPEH